MPLAAARLRKCPLLNEWPSLVNYARALNVFLCHEAPALPVFFTPIQTVHASLHPFHQRPKQSLRVCGGWQLFPHLCAGTRLTLAAVILARRIVPTMFAYWESV